ncbi:hypothetical protein LSAT2_006073, partial [Lamellibrachia satsuma]
AERIYHGSQCGFRTGRSTTDMIFSVQQLQEKCEQRRPLYITFIDLTKAFDLVSRSGLFKLLEKTGCHSKLLSVTSSCHDNMKGTVKYDSTDISWQDRVMNTEVLKHTHSSSIYTLLSQRRLQWPGHVHRMADGHMPKDLYGEL